MRYWFEIFHTPGSQMDLADMLARPAKDATGVEFERCWKVEMHVSRMIESQDMYDDQILEEICARGLEDELHQRVLSEIKSCWVEKGKCYKNELKRYYSQRDKLTIANGLVRRDNKVVFLANLRQGMLERIHRGHQGTEKCIRRVRSNMW